MTVFTKLKFKPTKFSFKNKRDLIKYFDNELIIGSKNYVNKVKEQAEETLQIIFSYYIILQYISFILLAISVLTTIMELPFIINFFVLCIGIIIFFHSIILKFEAEKRMFGVKLGIKMLSLENFASLEDQRKLLIEEQSILKEVEEELKK